MDHALSIRQPWAALVVHGVKTIEIRRWPTRFRGRVLIHAGQTADARPETWTKVPASLQEFAHLQGGILGVAEVVDCRKYSTPDAFKRDQRLHLNDPSWFQGPVMYGFVLANARPLAFHRCPGNLYFFELEALSSPQPAAVGLLVSVRTPDEAATAVDGGADVIDIKEPNHGSLGKAPNEVISDVMRVVAGRRPVSAAFGELRDLRETPALDGLAFVKCGLAGLGARKSWERKLLHFRERIAQQSQPPTVVTTAYVDWKRADSPPWQDVARFALRQPGGVLLLDTFDKKGPSRAGQRRPSTLLDWLSIEEATTLCQQCHDAGVRVALAGSLGLRHIVRLAEARPAWFAVRGAVCEANKRDGEVHLFKVHDLAHVVQWHQPASGES